MANTLTDLYPDLYEALDIVSRERVGYIPAVSLNASVARAAVNEVVRVPVTRAHAAADTTPAVTPPNTGDATVDNVSIQITKSRHVPIRFNGEETKGLTNAGIYQNIRAARVAEAMRTLTNEMEADLHACAYKGASRGYGTAGTTPFATAADLSDFAGVAQILDENGAPKLDWQLVIGHSALANLRGKQSGLFKVNEAGSADMLRNGMTDRIQGFAIRHSNAVGVHTKGTGASYLLNGALAVGDTSITVDTGSGTILAGDIVTFQGTLTKYVVNTALASSVFAIGKPGSLAIEADNDTVTVGNNYTPNVAFDRSAIVLANRAPALPEGGDMATERGTIVDPVSGLVFEIAYYPQFMQGSWLLFAAWGCAAIKPNHIATLLG